MADRPTLLFYDPGTAPFAAKLPGLCAMEKLKLRRVYDADLNSLLGELAAGTAVPLPPVDAPLPEPVLVFCGLSGAQLDRALLLLRRQKVFCLKAVLTHSNASWTFRALHAELVRERDRLGG